jgi:hypothetical protein
MSLNNIPGRGNSTNRTTGTEALSDLVRYIKKIFNISAVSSESITSIETIILRSNWTTIVGNSVTYTYNGNNDVTVAEYYTGATLVFTQTFTYDVNNNCTDITVS